MWISIFAIILFLLYTVLILYYQSGWAKLIPFDEKKNPVPDTIHFSIIVPARNESANITQCLQSILEQDYPKEAYEVLVVDDFSEDDTAELVQRMAVNGNIRLISMRDFYTEETRAPKKKAIETAIGMARGTWIVTTDADCVVPPRWLSSINGYAQTETLDFVAVPVDYVSETGFLSIFQSLDFLSLQGITGAAAAYRAHVLCNGANLAYRKSVFQELNGFQGIDHIATGDDMLLMQKFYERKRDSVGYLFSSRAIVRTRPMPTWKSFLHQRIRWASKADQYKDWKIFSVLLLVYLVNLSFPILAIRALFEPGYGWFLFSLLVCKTLLELYFLFPVARFFGKTWQLVWFPLAQPFHILYTVIAGWMGKFGSYEWKGRAVKRT